MSAEGESCLENPLYEPPQKSRSSERMPVDDPVKDCFKGASVKSFNLSSAAIIWITPEKGKA
jgi:hypothetical protein